MNQITFHRVSADERLSGIAALHGVHVQDIVAANPHKPRLQLPSGAVVFASLGAGEDIALPALYLEPGVLGTDPTATTNLASAVTRLIFVARGVLGGSVPSASGAMFWSDDLVQAMMALLKTNWVQPHTSGPYPTAEGINASDSMAAQLGAMKGGDWIASMIAQGRVVVSSVTTANVLNPSQFFWPDNFFVAYDPVKDKTDFDEAKAGKNVDNFGAAILTGPASVIASLRGQQPPPEDPPAKDQPADPPAKDPPTETPPADAPFLTPAVMLGTDPPATTNLASAVTRLKTMAIVIRTVEGGVAGAILGGIAGAVKGDAALKGGAIGAAGGALLAGVVTAVMLSGSPKPT
jgi:hypothetical protein